MGNKDLICWTENSLGRHRDEHSVFVMTVERQTISVGIVVSNMLKGRDENGVTIIGSRRYLLCPHGYRQHTDNDHHFRVANNDHAFRVLPFWSSQSHTRIFLIYL